MKQVKTPKCMVCGKTSVIQLTENQYHRLTRGTGHIQDDLRDLSPAHRELLITGTHDECWTKMFADADIEDEEM